MNAKNVDRRYDLDWLRVLAILAIFVFHCTRFFDMDDWGIKNPTTYLSVNIWKEFAIAGGMSPYEKTGSIPRERACKDV